MTLRPPEGFSSVADATSRRDNGTYNVIGICVDYLPPTQTLGTDMSMKFNIWDVSCNQTDIGHSGLLTRHFFKSECRFPAVAEAGDVVLLTNMQTINAKGVWLSRSSFKTRWVVIDGRSLLESVSPTFADVRLREPYQPSIPRQDNRGPRPADKEFRYAKALLQQCDRKILHGPSEEVTAHDRTVNGKADRVMSAATKSTKFRLIQDLVPPSANSKLFVDIVGELQNIYLSSRPMELKVSDYTENALLYDYGIITTGTLRKNGWTYPTGKMTLQVNLWDGMADYVDDLASKAQIQAGMFVRLQNVNVRMDKQGGRLEGHLRGGASHGTAITFLRLEDTHKDQTCIDLRKRIRAYKLAQKADLMAAKRVADNSDEESLEQPPKKKVKSRQKHKRKKERAKAEAQTEERAMKEVEVRPVSNRNIRCEAIDVDRTSLADILDNKQLEQKTETGTSYRLPFRNCKYKARVQVIDFFPDKLEDFAIPCRKKTHMSSTESDEDIASQQSNNSDNSDEEGRRWEWYFFLMVQDPKGAVSDVPNTEPMLLQVAGADAEYLLNMEACDLRKDRIALHRLKEKLFVLWGDLEEKKTEHNMTGEELEKESILVSSTSFDCMIKEFGVPAQSKGGIELQDQWERMFALFKTNIS